MALRAVGQLPQSENQIWFDGQYARAISKKVDLIPSGGVRLGRGMDHFVYERIGGYVAFRVLPVLTLAPSYNYVATQPLEGRDTRESRYAVDATIAPHLGRFQFSDRNRFEWRVLPLTSYFRYMNRFQISHPVAIESWRFSVWVADEVFYYGKLDAWARNRFSTGITKRVSPGVALDFFYLRQNDGYSRPGDINAFGMSFKAAHR